MNTHNPGKKINYYPLIKDEMQGNQLTGKQRLSYLTQVSESRATVMLLIQNTISPHLDY